jgi:hypothetical protein
LCGSGSTAIADEATCPPQSRRVRVELEAPEAVAAYLKAVLAAGREPEAKNAALRAQMEATGCAHIAEQASSRLRAANLTCTLPGSSPTRIVVGTSPDTDGDGAAALLPALATVLQRETRAHTFELVAFGREPDGSALGAWMYADAMPAEQPVELFFHVGAVGFGDSYVEAGSDAGQRCALQGLAGEIGVPLRATPGEPLKRILKDCYMEPSGSRFATTRCETVPAALADRFAFSRRRIAVVGLTGSVPRSSQLGAVAHYSAYRLASAYLIHVDRELAEGSAGPTPP